MFNRYGVTNDNLGVWESMQDLDQDNNLLNISASFKLAFSHSRDKIFELIKNNHLEVPLQIFYKVADTEL